MTRTFPSIASLLAALPLGVALLAGCPETPPEIDGGVTPSLDSGPGTDGGDEGETPAGENCANAIPITPGTTESDTATADDDFQGSCDTFSDEGSAGGDRVFTFTLDEESGVNIVVTGYDAILYLFEGSACSNEVTCADAVGNEELLSFAALPAGEYYLVVDTFIGELDQDGNRQDEGAPFTLELEITDPSCLEDQFDAADGSDNNTPDGAVNAGFQDIDTQDLEPGSAEPEGLRLSVCPDDVDYFSIGHIGGTLEVTVSGLDGDEAPSFDLYEATPTIEDDDIAGYTEGAAVNNGDVLGRGMYLLKLSADSTPVTGLDYGFAVAHGCQGDGGDDPIAQFDDGLADNAPSFLYTPEEPVARRVCGDDTDSFVLNNLLAGDITVTLAGGSELPLTAYSVTEGDDGARTTTALSEGSEYTTTTTGGDLVITFADADAGMYMITVGSGGSTTELEYTFTAVFEALADPPANDTCGTGATLTPATSPSPLFGRTLGATHTLQGPTITDGDESFSCNGDGEVIADTELGPAPEVFYYLTLDEAVDLDLRVDGSASDFRATLYAFNLEDLTCPADLSTLTPVQVGDAPLCETGVNIRGRVPQAPAGDYLVVVDGTYSPPFEFFGFVFPEQSTRGTFELSAVTHPDGFPPPQACVEATAVDVPSAGSPTTFTVTYDGAPEELQGECGGNGAERVYSLEPAADVTLDIVTGGGAGEVDTVAYVMEGSCDDAAALEATCNDDGTGIDNFGSALTVSLTGGTTYYLVVDAYDETSGTAGVTISVAD